MSAAVRLRAGRMGLTWVSAVGEFVVITGLSGAGRSTAAATFEDLGWFVIDNVPPSLIGKVAELVGQPGSETEKVAFVVGRGGSEWVYEVGPALDRLTRRRGNRVRTVFLDASDEALVRRFEGTRRRHPVAGEGVSAAIASERALLESLKTRADVVIDTSEMNVHQLRDRLTDLFGADVPDHMVTSVLSFGYKYGLPIDVDLVLDCRFLPNPHWIEDLRPLTGTDAPVRQYVLDQPEAADFLDRLKGLFAMLLPAFSREGKSYLTIAVGCTGGRHRSVVVAEELGRMLDQLGFPASVNHRDVTK